MEEAKLKIRSFLCRSFRTQDLRDDEDIFSLGFVNSLFAMQLVMFIEKEFGVTVDQEDLEIENFATLDAMAGLIERKLKH